MSDEDDIETEEDVWDGTTYFCDCTCEHDEEEHGWGECLVEGCPCEGGWEE